MRANDETWVQNDNDFKAIQYEAAVWYLSKKGDSIYIDLPRLSRYNRLLETLRNSFLNRWI